MKEQTWTKKRIFFALAGMIACVILSLIPAPESLASAAHSVGSNGTLAMRILGITVFAVCWWVGNVCPDWVTTIAMMFLWILVGKVSFTSAFAAFSGTTVWLIVGAFCLAAAVTKTGLFTRISWFLIRIFSPTYKGQVLALMVVGAICTPLIPSLTAKAVLGVTIASGVADAMGYAKNSRGRYGLCMAGWIGFGSTAPAFVSGSVFGYTLLGALPEGETVTWGSWAVAMIPWLIIVLAGSYFALTLLYKPEGDSAITKSYAIEKYKALGKLKGKELISAFILIGAVILWMLESTLKVDAAVTALIAAFLCFVLNILDKKEIATAPTWNLVIFLGGVLSLGSVFSAVGINVWLQALLSPIVVKIGNPFIAVVILFLMVVLIRFVLVSQSATIIIMMAILTPVATTIGLSPFITGIIIYAAEGVWLVPYQSATFATAFTCTKGMLEYKGTVKSCIAYVLVSLIGCLISIPYWTALHYI